MLTHCLHGDSVVLKGIVMKCNNNQGGNKLKSLLEIEADDCRFPVGDTKDPDFGFCGKKVKKGAYCAEHREIAYRKVVKDGTL